jgi:glycosyltransferase involved in cell wall biosynthesis
VKAKGTVLDILYVSTLYPPSIGGAQIQLHCLAKAMKQTGHGAHVITLAGNNRQDWLRMSTVFPEPTKKYQYEGVDVTQLGFPLRTRVRMLPWAVCYYALIRVASARIASYTYPNIEAAANAPSLVHVTRIGREFIAQAALDLARKRGVPYVLTPNHHPRWRGRLYVEYDKLYRGADAVLVYTDTEKETLIKEKGVSEERVHVTGVGPVLSDRHSPDAFRAKHRLEAQPFVLFLGQQHKYKGIEAILKAAPLVWRRHPDVKFLFIGPHTKDSSPLFRSIHDPRIINLGVVDDETKTSALAACTLLCLPSIQESFGGVYAEAWCFRKAVIGGRIPPIASVIDDGVNGLLTSQDPNELAEKMSFLLSNPAKCEAMGNAGWNKVQEKYTWERLARKTLDVYEQLLR